MVQITSLRPKTSGTRIADGIIEVDGTPIQQIIENYSFIDTLVYMTLGRVPEEKESKMLESYLVAMCDHGDTSPSTIGPKITSNSGASFPMAMINHISLASGNYHFGALELAMQEIKHIGDYVADIEEYVERKLESGERLWGFGHRFHKLDPRVDYLSHLANDLEYGGKYMETAERVEEVLYEKKELRRNIDGFGSGLLLDIGFPSQIALLLTSIARLPKIARQHLEESEELPGKYVGLVDRTVSNSIKKEAISK
jgi:citrate synthase